MIAASCNHAAIDFALAALFAFILLCAFLDRGRR